MKTSKLKTLLVRSMTECELATWTWVVRKVYFQAKNGTKLEASSFDFVARLFYMNLKVFQVQIKQDLIKLGFVSSSTKEEKNFSTARWIHLSVSPLAEFWRHDRWQDAPHLRKFRFLNKKFKNKNSEGKMCLKILIKVIWLEFEIWKSLCSSPLLIGWLIPKSN